MNLQLMDFAMIMFRYVFTAIAVTVSVTMIAKNWRKRHQLSMDAKMMHVVNALSLPFAIWFLILITGMVEFGAFQRIHWMLLVSGITGSLLCIVSSVWVVIESSPSQNQVTA